ncbi:MAG: hypothetical protein JXR47_05305 [Thiotrichales bacterium]|nr:hypothetical protein [Thiotrichales bacterium]
MSKNSYTPTTPNNDVIDNVLSKIIDIRPHIKLRLMQQNRLPVPPNFKPTVRQMLKQNAELQDTLFELLNSNLTTDDAYLIDQLFEVTQGIHIETQRLKSEILPC